MYLNKSTNKIRYQIIKTFLNSIKMLLDHYNNLIVIGVVDCIVFDKFHQEILVNIDKRIKILYLNTNYGISFATNVGIEYLIRNKCEYIFSSDDDIIIKDVEVLNIYINAIKITGIKHFCYYPSNLYKCYHIIYDNYIYYDGGYSGCFYCFTRDVIFEFGYLPLLPEKYGYEHELFTKNVTGKLYDIINSFKYIELNVDSLQNQSNNNHIQNSLVTHMVLPKFINNYYWYNIVLHNNFV